jgi:hypothetical protein
MSAKYDYNLLGLNFSHREAEQRGLEPREALRAILIHLKPTLLRLSLYWDEIAAEPGVYDLSETQWALDRAQSSGCRVLLTVGFKPQRHPAFTPPLWLAGAEHDRLTANTLMMLERAVALLADYNAIDAWEAEYLPFLPAADQPTGWSVGKRLLQRQLDVLRDVDPRHRPIVLSHTGGHLLQSGWREALIHASVLGCSLQASQLSAESPPRAISAITARRLRIWQLSLQAKLAANFNRQLWVTELIDDTLGDGDEARRLSEAVASATGAGASRIYLRGAEEWMVMRRSGQTGPWDSARDLLR